MAFASGEPLPTHVPVQSVIALVYLAIFGSIIAFTAYLFLLRAVRPALSASYAYVNPPVAVLIGALVAGEQVGTLEVAGMVVILLGVALITLAKALPLRRAR